jgi:NAD(P)H-hydrate epimerase
MIRLTREQVREIDRRSIEEYGIPGIVLMENAAAAVADRANGMIWLERKGPQPQPGSALIICGGGNNGGDGLSVARYLHNRGHDVRIQLASPIDRYTGDALTNLKIVQAMKLPLQWIEQEQPAQDWVRFDLIIDALFGTGLSSTPRDTRWIDYMNSQKIPVLAIDVPSGLDCDTGYPHGACVRAKHTVTFVREKRGFGNPESRQYTGTVTVADIGCPRELIEEFSHPRDNMNPS